MSLMEFSAVQLAGKIKKKECTCREAVKEAFRQIEEKEAKFHCYISLDKERALKRAEQVQAAIDAGELAGPLAGVPIAVKDNICTKDVKNNLCIPHPFQFCPFLQRRSCGEAGAGRGYYPGKNQHG